MREEAKVQYFCLTSLVCQTFSLCLPFSNSHIIPFLPSQPLRRKLHTLDCDLIFRYTQCVWRLFVCVLNVSYDPNVTY